MIFKIMFTLKKVDEDNKLNVFVYLFVYILVRFLPVDFMTMLVIIFLLGWMIVNVFVKQ